MLMAEFPRKYPNTNNKVVLLHARCQWYSPTCHRRCRRLRGTRVPRNCPYRDKAKDGGVI